MGNLDARYASATIPSSPDAPVDQSAGVAWHQYVQCGYKGAWDSARSKGLTAPPRGLCLMVDGRVPAGAAE